MPRPAFHLKVNLTGTLVNGEEFQTGFWVAYTLPAFTQAELQSFADDVATAFTANSAGIRNLLSSTSEYGEVRVYEYTAAGPAPATKIAVADLSLAGTGSGAGLLPNQVALVATLRTALVGRRYRGRMYFPANASVLVAHQFSQAQIDAVASDVATFFGAVNDIDSHEPRVSVVSGVGSTSVPVTGIGVDSRADVQRRRAEQETELRQAETSVPA